MRINTRKLRGKYEVFDDGLYDRVYVEQDIIIIIVTVLISYYCC